MRRPAHDDFAASIRMRRLCIRCGGTGGSVCGPLFYAGEEVRLGGWDWVSSFTWSPGPEDERRVHVLDDLGDAAMSVLRGVFE
jgi:hypothetical protein